MLKRLRYLRMGRSRSQSGDTIVEVLIVLAVLSLALSLSYATANRGLAQSRNAAEHSEALGILNTQVELVRTALAKQVTLPVGTTPPAGNTSLNFCMADTTNPPSIVGFGTYTVPNNPATDNAITNTPPQPVYPAACVSPNGFYHTSIVYDTGTGSYDFRVRWDGAGRLGRQQEEFNYKITPIAAAAGYGADPVLNTPTIQVLVKRILPNAGNGAPGCASSNPQVTRAGTPVTLSSGQTGFSGTNIISLVDGQPYTASASVPHFTMCSSTSEVAKTITPFNQITVVIAPTCDQTQVVGSHYAKGAPRPELNNFYLALNYGGGTSHFLAGHISGIPGLFWYQYEYSAPWLDPNAAYYTLYNADLVNDYGPLCAT